MLCLNVICGWKEAKLIGTMVGTLDGNLSLNRDI